MLATAGEDIRRSNVRLRLAIDDLHKELASKDKLIKQMKESYETELQKVWEEEVATMSKKVVRECRVRIDYVVEAVEKARKKDNERLEQLKARVKGMQKSIKELREELDSWRQEEISLKGHIGVLSVEKERMRNKNERFANKVVSLQAQLDWMEELQDMVSRMLKETYYLIKVSSSI